MPAIALAVMATHACGGEADPRGRQFVGFNSINGFNETQGQNPGEKTFTSPIIRARIPFNEVVASWNVDLSKEGYLMVEVRALYGDTPIKYYDLGQWSKDPARHPRQSVANQKDLNGDVSTDTLILRHPANQAQIRLTFGAEKDPRRALKFLGLSLTDTNASLVELPANQKAWGRVIPAPERTQMIYPNGATLCSPTTVSMLMGYWAGALKRPELDRQVPEIVEAIYDSQWKGTGNWPFNMAYAGSFPGMRAYVTRLSDVAELEDWIAGGLPVGLSLDYDRLRGKGRGPNGHLVVLVGFTKEGDPILNDPGTSQHVRKVFPRKNLIDAWSTSRNTVYLIYPENAVLPEDRFGHWDSLHSMNQ